jgi:hypothetical protein
MLTTGVLLLEAFLCVYTTAFAMDEEIVIPVDTEVLIGEKIENVQQNVVSITIDDLLQQLGEQDIVSGGEYVIVTPTYQADYPGLKFNAYFDVTVECNSDSTYSIVSINDWGVAFDFGNYALADGIKINYSMTTPYYWGNNDRVSSRVTIELRTSGLLDPFSTKTYSVTAKLSDN